MKLEVKKVETFTGKDGIGLSADLYVDGKLTAHCFDGATGGMMDFTVRNRELFQKLETHCETLPPRDLDMGNGEIVKLPVTVEDLVNDLAKEVLLKKENKKLEKYMETAFLIGNDESYKIISWSDKNKKGAKVPLKQIPAHILQQTYDKLKSELKKEERFLNTNLKELGIKI